MIPRLVQWAICVAYVAILIPMSSAGAAPGRDGSGLVGSVDVATAAVVARHHLLRLELEDAFAPGAVRTLCDPSTGVALCHCVALLPQGYVVVSGDTALPPVIAYSFTSDAGCDQPSENPLTDLLEWDLRLRLDHPDLLPAAVVAERRGAWAEYLGQTPSAPRDRLFQQWPKAGSTTTGGWVTTNWTQDVPYKNLCPLDLAHGGRSLAGCPAVAMAQILNYHARLNGTHFNDADDYYHNYNGNQFWIDNAYASRDFPAWPQLNAYLLTLFDSFFRGAPPTDTSKAALVYACGVAAHQVYGASGSGTFAVAQAFQAFQRFGCDTARLLDANDPTLFSHLSENMMNAHPAHLAIVNASWTSGHNLVVDGYNTDEYYHLNFGWGGSYDGWYRLPSELPFGLTVIEGLIVNIMIDACAPLDCTCDGHVAWDDFMYFAECARGPLSAFGPPGCSTFDTDADRDVDVADFARFQAAFGQGGS